MKKTFSLRTVFFTNTVALFALVLFLMPTSTLANHVDAEISISTASPIFVSVSNLSGSTNVNERLLTMITPAEITVKGHAQCKNGSAAQSVQLHFGLDYIESSPKGHKLWGIWDSSEPYLPETISTAYSISHNINISPTWELGTLVTLHPNAVKVVEDNLKAYVSNGGSAIDFLRADASFETVVIASATVACERDGSVFYDTVSKPTTMHVLYKGDPNLEAQTIGQNPNQVNPNQPGSPSYALPPNLPKPGLTPASRLYFVGRLFEGVGTFFTFGDDAKAERYLTLAEKRLAEAMLLAEEGDARAQIAIARYENQFEKAKERAERKGLNAVNVKTARDVGDQNTESDITTEQMVRDFGQFMDGDRSFGLLARITDATTKHLTVLDEVLERVPEQAKTSIEAAKERSIRGQIESLRGIAEIDPETAILIFARVTEARVAYYVKFGDIKGEARAGSSGLDPDTSLPNDFLRGFEEYAEFGKELSEMAPGVRVGETTINSLVERIAYRDRKILELVIERVPEDARESLQQVVDKATPKLTDRTVETISRPPEQRGISAPPQRSVPENVIERAPVEVSPRVERGDETGAIIIDALDPDDDGDGIPTQIESDLTQVEVPEEDENHNSSLSNENGETSMDNEADDVPIRTEPARTAPLYDGGR